MTTNAATLAADPVISAPQADSETNNPLKELVTGDGSYSLPKLIQLYQAIEEALIQSGGLAEYGDQMAIADDKIEQKLDNYKGLIDYWKGQIAYLDEKEKTYKNRKVSIKNGIEWLRGTMRVAMLCTGKQKIKTVEGTYFFKDPLKPLKLIPELITAKYDAALKRLDMKKHSVIITFPSTLDGEYEKLAEELTANVPGSSWRVSDPEYDLDTMANRWLQGNRNLPPFLKREEKTFNIR